MRENDWQNFEGIKSNFESVESKFSTQFLNIGITSNNRIVLLGEEGLVIGQQPICLTPHRRVVVIDKSFRLD